MQYSCCIVCIIVCIKCIGIFKEQGSDIIFLLLYRVKYQTLFSNKFDYFIEQSST